MARPCIHDSLRYSAPRPFAAPIADSPNPNPLAHGGVVRTVTCNVCGARRLENSVGGRHYEVGPFVGGAS